MNPADRKQVKILRQYLEETTNHRNLVRHWLQLADLLLKDSETRNREEDDAKCGPDSRKPDSSTLC